MANPLVLGLDYGTDSVRALVVDATTGEELGTAVSYYPRWKQGLYCDAAANQFRQHPQDYLDSLVEAVSGAIADTKNSDAAERIRAIGIDTTGSTPVAVNREGVPLAMLSEFAENPNAMFVLWKDHTAVAEAEEINSMVQSWGGENYAKYEGGIYSSEWFWSKILHVLREDSAVRDAAFSWVEHADWMPAVLTGRIDPLSMKRSRCAAGHKAMWHASFNGLPSEEFLTRLDPLLAGLRDRLFTETQCVDTPVGTLTREWAEKLGLSDDTVVAVAAFDAHLGAVGCGCKPYQLVKIMGTSTCDTVICPADELGDNLVNGICGQVDGSIVPGMIGLEAGQSAFGDIYAWFRDMVFGVMKVSLKASSTISVSDESLEQLREGIIPMLMEQAATLPVDVDAELAIDWMNGRRTPDADQSLKGALFGLNLGSDAARIFRSLVEATVFGARRIVDRFEAEGVPIREVIALGGVAKKSPLVMQITADVFGRAIKVARSEQTCALGSAMAAAVCAGIYESIEAAQAAMNSGFDAEYFPIPENVSLYNRLYERYCRAAEKVEALVKER